MNVLTITSSNLHTLEVLKGAEPGSVHLKCEEASDDMLTIIMKSLQDSGRAIGMLDIGYWSSDHPYRYDMVNFDFVSGCPNMEELNLKCCEAGASLLKHPRLKKLRLDECWWCTEDLVEIGTDSTSALEELMLYDTNWSNMDKSNIGKLSIGTRSSLMSFKYSLDEDSVEAYPEDIEINGCPFLESIRIDIDADWRLTLKGDLPKLVKHSFGSGRYSNHQLDFAQVGDKSAAELISIRNGEGLFKGMIYVFLGDNKHFQVNKVRHVIRVYGGIIKDNIDAQVTHAVLLGEASDEWDSEDLVEENLLKLRDLLDDGSDIELVMDNEAVEHFEDWY